jgi:diguanylate cyclase (GGDEF)-like protein
VAFLDLDRFKNINDSLGHHVGDELLVQVAQRLATAVRETDTVARLGGDEFVVVLQGMRGSSGTAHVADKLLARLSEPYVVQGSELHTTPSIGISLFPDDSEEPATLLRNADTAMYHAKAAGRANYQFYTEEMNRIATARLDLERKLRQALARREFELWYQPQFASSDGALTGLEALVRWRHPEDGLIAPAHFIPLAEETGIIMEIGTWVLGEACRQLRHWLDTRLPAVRMSVNLSVRQLRDAHLAETVAAVLAGTGLSPGLLELEITESSVMDKPQKAIAVLTALKALGVRIAIDDFGTGHSSLSYLKLFPLDHLKIDRSFVSDIEHDANDAAIVAAAVSLAHNLGLSVVAEGVESAVQVARLRELGCDELQGYHFSRPLPAAEIEQFMRARLATPA